MTVSRWLMLMLYCFMTASVAAKGIGSNNDSAACVAIERDIRGLVINDDQATNGVEGGVLIANDCKKLVSANVLMYRTEELQKELCDNSCYSTINKKYNTLLDNDCYASSDTDESASANLQAAAYQIACQTTTDGKYCIPMLATLVANADTGYDLCSDIVKDMGCCFQSYKQYMKFGTPASIKILDTIQETCSKQGVDGLDKVCPCGASNIYNKHALNGTTICSEAVKLSLSLIVAIVVVGWTTAAAAIILDK